VYGVDPRTCGTGLFAVIASAIGSTQTKGKTMSEGNQSKKPDLVAYQVSQAGDKSYYHRIGAGWSNSKGGAKVKLDAFPVNGEILLMPLREREDEAPG
jgi:hypothetical protein